VAQGGCASRGADLLINCQHVKKGKKDGNRCRYLSEPYCEFSRTPLLYLLDGTCIPPEFRIACGACPARLQAAAFDAEKDEDGAMFDSEPQLVMVDGEEVLSNACQTGSHLDIVGRVQPQSPTTPVGKAAKFAMKASGVKMLSDTLATSIDGVQSLIFRYGLRPCRHAARAHPLPDNTRLPLPSGIVKGSSAYILAERL
jgi:hypothetical protein